AVREQRLALLLEQHADGGVLDGVEHQQLLPGGGLQPDSGADVVVPGEDGGRVDPGLPEQVGAVEQPARPDVPGQRPYLALRVGEGGPGGRGDAAVVVPGEGGEGEDPGGEVAEVGRHPVALVCEQVRHPGARLQPDGDLVVRAVVPDVHHL